MKPAHKPHALVAEDVVVEDLVAVVEDLATNAAAGFKPHTQ